MTPELTALVIAASVFVLLHVAVAGSPLRWAIVGRIGEPGFQGMFSLLTLVAFGSLIWTYRGAAAVGVNYDLWLPTRATLWAPLVAMPFVLLLLIASLTAPNPTSVGMEKALQAEEPARGLLRVTRHPMLWGMVLWSAAHLVANGDAASTVVFAAIGTTALNGMFSIDRKRARRDPEGWRRYAARTSIVPFAAILGGRNRFVVGEVGLWRVGLAVVATGLGVAIHPYLIGVSPLPF